MSEQDPSIYHYPNKMGRIILLSLEEVIGRNGVVAMLNHADLQHYINTYPPNSFDLQFRFDEVSRMQQSLEELYGPRAGRGIALRAGRVCFKYGLKEFGPMLGVTDLAFRLLPLESKLQSGAQVFSDIFNKFSDQRVHVEMGPEQIYWHIERCPICWQRKTDGPSCHLAVGILQESLYWVSGGKYFYTEEIACVANGAPSCTILIEKQSLE